MTIIADEKEFQEDFRSLLDMCSTHIVIIQRKDGLFFALNEIESLPEEEQAS